MELVKTIPIIEEEVTAEGQPVKTGSVRVQKHVEQRIERIEDDVLRDAAEIRRVPIGRAIAEMPKLRQEGGVTIVPIVEEEITVSKRLILKEELHIIRRRTVERVVKEVPILRESAVVEHLDKEGRVIDQRGVAGNPSRSRSPKGAAEVRPKRPRSILE
ncbi:MAG: YsnF/AvaK domain-containing protein [Acidobacteriota bacterium]|nr:YsnF/AvaK domain-containing protein [Acidobacteriota bacterium]